MANDFCKECVDFGKCNPNDCPYFEDEQMELEEKAKKMPRKYEKTVKNDEKSSKKPKTVKVSQEKQELFDILHEGLFNFYENVEILKQNKLISVQINGKTFKIDVIEQRPPK